MTTRMPGPIPIVLVAGGMVTLSFNLFLPVIPILAERSGPQGAAGAATGTLFMAMVVGESMAPWLMSKWSASRLLFAVGLMIAVSSLAYSIPKAGLIALLSAAFVRGFGTGLALVVCLALVTRMAAANRRGRVVGYFGLVTGAPSIVCPSIGVWLLATNHLNVAVMISFLAAVLAALLGLALRLPITGVTSIRTSALAAMRRPGILAVSAALALFSCAYGGVFTYIPVALTSTGFASAAVFFLASGGCRAVGRWLFGLLGDRISPKWILVGGIALAILGLVAVATSLQPAFVVFAAIAYGLGSGAVQTGSYLSLAERSRRSEWDIVSALWNIALDLGSAAGSAVMGVAAALYGYSIGIWLMPAIVALSLPLVLLAGSRLEEPPVQEQNRVAPDKTASGRL